MILNGLNLSTCPELDHTFLPLLFCDGNSQPYSLLDFFFSLVFWLTSWLSSSLLWPICQVLYIFLSSKLCVWIPDFRKVQVKYLPQWACPLTSGIILYCLTGLTGYSYTDLCAEAEVYRLDTCLRDFAHHATSVWPAISLPVILGALFHLSPY